MSDANRVLQRYAKQFHAGAFATPTRAELETADVRWWGDDVGVARRLPRSSVRRDWTGHKFFLPAGAHVLTHLGRVDVDASPPDLGEFDLVRAYREDTTLTEAMRAAGRVLVATQITAASEIIAWWGWGSGRTEDPVDLLTVGGFDIDIDLEATATEVEALSGWEDDYPFYSDGSWSALSLRGFRDDPAWGVKPAEMSRDWKAEHPEALAYRCDWTTLAPECPASVAAVKGVPWWAELERVRLLRMEGRRNGRLSRHCDITDRAAGTRPGQVARFHVPLITDPAATMTVWELDGTRRTLSLSPGRAWYLDARKPHAVDNPTDVDRVHLVVDAIVTPEIRDVLSSAL